MKTEEEIINEYWTHPTDLLKDVPKMISEARKEAATEFFKWHWKNYSSHPNEEEIIERYNEFIKENS